MFLNNPELLLVLLIGFVLMSLMISVQMKWYGISRWKSIIISVALVFTGLFGSRIWFYLENGYFEGRSFYGVIFLAPIVFFPVSRFFRIPYGAALDFCAPAGCLTLAMVKVQCLRDGCCGGFIMGLNANNEYIKFPSQMVEMIAFLIISAALMYLGSKPKNKGRIFPLFLLLYGGSRFVLNFLREAQAPYALGLSAGSFWSLWAFLAGALVLGYLNWKEKTAA